MWLRTALWGNFPSSATRADTVCWNWSDWLRSLPLEHLLDLPVEPHRCLIQQGPVLAGAVLLEKFIGILAGGQLQDPQLHLALQRKMLHLADGPLGRPHPGGVGVEVEDQPLAVAAAAQLGDLLLAQGRAQGRHGVGDARPVEGDHIEVALHHHRPIGAADRVSRPFQAEQVFAFLEQLGFGGIEVFGLPPIQGAAAETDHPALAVADRHHHPMAETVVETSAPLAGHHQAGGLQQLRGHALHLAQVFQQAVPSVRGVAQLEVLQAGGGQLPLPLQVSQGLLALRPPQLALKPAGRQGQHPVEPLPAGELLAQPLLLGGVDGVHRQLVPAGQLQHHIAEAAALQLHQKLDRIAAGTAGEAVVELLGWRHRHRRRGVVVEGADPDELPPLFLQHHMLSHHIDDVGPFLDGFDRAGVEAGKSQGGRGVAKGRGG